MPPTWKLFMRILKTFLRLSRQIPNLKNRNEKYSISLVVVGAYWHQK